MLSPSPVAWLSCARCRRRRQRGKHEVPRLKIHGRGASKHSLDSPFDLGAQAGWSMAASILTADVRTAPEQRNDKRPTSARTAPEFSGEHRKRMCTCRKPMFPRQNTGGHDCPQKRPATVGHLSGNGQFLTNPKTL